MTAEVQAPTREATLTLLLRQGESSAAKLAVSMGISVQAMRRHLRSLENDGLVESSLTSLGPGRPLNLWQLTNQGQSRFNTGNASENFALELLSSVEEALSSEMLEEALSKQALDKAAIYRKKIGSGDLSVRLQKLVELRNKEGYLADLHSETDGISWYLNAFHCSISTIAEKYPMVCHQELAFIRYIFPECLVKRVQWRLENCNSCGFQITPIIPNEG